MLNIVESDFENDVRFDAALVAEVFDRVGQEIVGELADLDVGQAGIGFADVDEALVVTDGEGVIGEEAATLAMAVFGEGDHDVEGGQRTLELHPELAATAGNIWGFGSFGEQAFVADGQRGQKTVFDFFDAAAEFGAGELQQRLLGFGEKALEEQTAFREGRIEEGAAIEEENVEGDEADRQVLAREEIDLLAAEALL